MDVEIAEFRRAERSRLLAARKDADASTYSTWSDAITIALSALIDRMEPALAGFYWPHRQEYDPIPLAGRLIAQGVEIALPAVIARCQPLEYRPWHPGIPMAKSPQSFGIPQPAQGPAVTPDVILAPLLGFDVHLYRLGYGGGFFDRTLAAYSTRPRTIGIGFEMGRMTTIRPQPHDIPLDMIVTESGVFGVDVSAG